MNGLLIINKEKGMTSHDVVSKCRRILKMKRIGHTGTLDPNATGVLVICLGEATKLVPYLEQDDKRYTCEVIVGLETDTFDITGNVLEQQNVSFTIEEIDKVLKSFIGTYDQYPPIYSAIKVNGKKLYQYARNNEDVEIKPRKVTIKSLIWDKEIRYIDNTLRFNIDVEVSKGTYIRSLCHDIGQRLNSIACMGELSRTRSGRFSLNTSVYLKDLENNNFNIIPMLDAILYPVLDVEEMDLVKTVYNGMKIKSSTIKDKIGCLPEILAFKKHNQLHAIYELEEGVYKVSRIWLF